MGSSKYDFTGDVVGNYFYGILKMLDISMFTGVSFALQLKDVLILGFQNGFLHIFSITTKNIFGYSLVFPTSVISQSKKMKLQII